MDEKGYIEDFTVVVVLVLICRTPIKNSNVVDYVFVIKVTKRRIPDSNPKVHISDYL